MLPVVIAVIVAILSVCGAWYADHVVLRCQTHFRLGITLALLGIGTWLVTVIHAAFWLRVPWAYGPVQFWHNAPGEAFMQVRVLALLLALAGFLFAFATAIATGIALFAPSPVQRWRRCIVPAVALAVFTFAYYVFFTYSFYPSA